MKRVRVVANKVRGPEDEDFVRSKIPAEDLLGFIHYNTDVIDADRQGKSPYDISQEGQTQPPPPVSTVPRVRSLTPL